ncbi:hypothetical protein [Bacillus timonensis]|uniref:hypothetical protein n=1 Tax=Bacillus timonensis TaxID=1033734 RepID=UPI00028911FA|nr:hypothetical protein [Bacillus timonensis]
MSNLQAKLGEGLSKFQGGIEQGKQKLQIVQEISRLKKKSMKHQQKNQWCYLK